MHKHPSLTMSLGQLCGTDIPECKRQQLRRTFHSPMSVFPRSGSALGGRLAHSHESRSALPHILTSISSFSSLALLVASSQLPQAASFELNPNPSSVPLRRWEINRSWWWSGGGGSQCWPGPGSDVADVRARAAVPAPAGTFSRAAPQSRTAGP